MGPLRQLGCRQDVHSSLYPRQGEDQRPEGMLRCTFATRRYMCFMGAMDGGRGGCF